MKVMKTSAVMKTSPGKSQQRRRAEKTWEEYGCVNLWLQANVTSIKFLWMMGFPLFYVRTHLLGLQRYIHWAYTQLFNLGSSPGKYESTCGSSGSGGSAVPLPLHVSFAHHTWGLLPPTGIPITSRLLWEPRGVTTGLSIHICNPFLFSCCFRAHKPIILRKEESPGSNRVCNWVNLEILALKCR